MEQSKEKPSLKNIGSRRKAVSVSAESLVRHEEVAPGQALPLVIRPAVEGLSLVSWAADNQKAIRDLVVKHGGVLFRGFAEKTIEDFERFTESVSLPLLEYKERSSPRSQVQGKVYTSTDYPPDQEIFLHNENSYQNAWPTKIFFFCAIEPENGGETPIADCRKIYQQIDPAIREKFIEKKWMAVRNFGDGFGLPWSTVFQTTDKAAVEAHCAKSGVTVEWKDGGRLRTRAVRPAAIKHPDSGEMTWFNHATFFNVSTLSPVVREAIECEFDDPEEMPTNSFYGDGSPIEPEVLDHLRDLYRKETVMFSWKQGDLLMLDNLFVVHGRAPFSGPRKIVVGMADPRTWADVA